MHKAQIIYLEVQSPQEKLKKLLTVIQYHFTLREKILILVPSQEVATFIDGWLWNPYSTLLFLPHCIVDKENNYPIAITTMQINLNQATVLISLIPEIPIITDSFNIVYELMDNTIAQNLAEAKKRWSTYHRQGYSLQLQ